MPNSVRVAVIGGGIIGFSSALYAIENVPGIQVTVFAEKFSPETTGDGSAGFWYPYLLGDVPLETFKSWCKETFQYLLSIWKSDEAPCCGVGLLSCCHASEKPVEDPPIKDIFLNWRDLTPHELSLLPNRYRYGKFFTTLYAECSKLLPFMMKRLQDVGVKIVRRRVHSLEEFIGDYDVVINCPGLGARNLVPDPAVQPIRGQTIRVSAPWIKHAVVGDDFYILPNTDVVICGGTHQKGDWNTEVDAKDRDMIWNGCCELVPSLKRAKIVKEWVGLRPGRYKPRLERETIQNKNGASLEVIHNYGHGGSGVTLFWGCAKDVTKLLKEIITDNYSAYMTSKL